MVTILVGLIPQLIVTKTCLNKLLMHYRWGQLMNISLTFHLLAIATMLTL